MSIFEMLKKWRQNRNINIGTYNHIELIGFLTEEITEGIRDKSEHSSVDWRADCIIFLINSIEQDGYDSEKVLLETIREINSRLQDPEQMEEWAKHGSRGEKWKKWKNQPLTTKYKADYSKCKRI